MKSVFGDSFYFIALLNARDYFHKDAVQLTRELSSEIVTTRWVIVEVGNALSGLGARECFGRFVHGLRLPSRVVVLPDTDALYDLGVHLFASRRDKEWSLTDCISFAAMRRLDIQDALTGDHHFAQAGFKPLMAANKA